MANIFTDGTPSFSKIEARNYFFQPIFVDSDFMQGYDVRFNVKSAFKLQKFGKLRKVTKARAKGFNATANTAISDRELVPYRMKAEAALDSDEFDGKVHAEMLKLGNERSSLNGTEIQRITSEILLKAISQDLKRQMWLNDSASGDADYNAYDGYFKLLQTLPAGQKLVYPAGAVMAADVAKAELEKTYQAAPIELLANIGNAVFEVTKSVWDNYYMTLIEDGTEAAHMEMQNGKMSLSYRGIPLRVNLDWDVDIAADTAAVDVHRIVLHAKSNLVIGTDMNANSGLEMWYNQDEQENRWRYEYVFGMQYKNTEYAVTNIAL